MSNTVFIRNVARFCADRYQVVDADGLVKFLLDSGRISADQTMEDAAEVVCSMVIES